MSEKRAWNPARDAVLCNADGQLTSRLTTILQDIFRRYDKDNDGALNEAELNSYAMACNGAPFDAATLHDIRENLTCTEAGALTRDGFLQLYELQTFSEPDETWKDLQKNGFDLNLNQKEVATAPAAVTEAASAQAELPR